MNIHESEELKKGANETVQYIGSLTIYIEIDERMSHDEFRSRVCGILNMQSDFLKIEFTVKFDPSSLILLCDDASCSDGMIFIVRFMFLHVDLSIVTFSSPSSNYLTTQNMFT